MKRYLVLLLTVFASGALAQKPQLTVPIGHSGDITSVAISPDNRYLLTGSADKTAKLWDLSGHEIQTFRGHDFVVSSVAFSPDGQSVLTGSYDGTVKRWELTGKLQKTYSGHKNYVLALAFSPDGKTFVSGSKDNTAILWSVSGDKLKSLEQADHVNAVAFSPDGKSILLGLENGTVRLVELSSWKTSVFKHSGSISSVDFSPNGRSILTVSQNGTAKRWDSTGAFLHNYEQEGGIQAAVFSAGGDSIFTGSFENGQIKIQSLEGKVLLTYEGHSFGVDALAISRDGQYILSGSADRSAKLWNPAGRTLGTLRGHSNNVTAMTCSPDGQYILTGSSEGSLKCSDLSGYQLRPLTGHKSRVNALAISTNGKLLLSGSADRTAVLQDLSGRVLHSLEGHKNELTAVAIAPNGQQVLTGSLDKTVRIWDTSGQLIKLVTETAAVKSLAFLPDGESFMTACEDQSIKIRDLSGNIQHAFTLPFQFNVAIVGPASAILTGAYNGMTQLWDYSGQPMGTFGNPGDEPVQALAFSADGKSILTGDASGRVKHWNVAEKTYKIYDGHGSAITAVHFLSSGNVASGSMDCTVKIWEEKFATERASLIALDSSDWVVTTPVGLFDASPGAMRLMYYIDQQNVIELEQLKERYYEPGVLPMLLGFAKENIRSVSSFSAVALYPEVDALVDTTRHELKISLKPRNGGLGKLSLFIGAKEIEEDINQNRDTSLTVDLRKYAAFFNAGIVDTLVLRAFNSEGWVRSPAIALPYQARFPRAKGTGTGADDGMQSLGATNPHLYGIFIGTSDYSGTALDLKFPDLDAAAMYQAMEGAGKLLFKDRVQLRLLSTSGKTATDIANRANIAAAFQDVAAKAQTGDVLLVYFSGHGVNYGKAELGQFYYLTKDIGSENLADSVIRNNFTVSSTELTEWLKQIPARKQVMILDACNSGKAVEAISTAGKKDLNTSRVRAIDRMKDRTGMYILTGSAADKVSYEDSQYGHGLLTYSLLQGMIDKASAADKRVDVMALFQHARDQVPELAKGIGGIQTPVIAFPLGGESIDIGIMDPAVKIDLKQPGKVFVRAEFQEERQFKDVLALSTAVDDYFRGIDGTDYVFKDIREYESAYSIKGRYTLTGDAVELRLLLFKGDTPLGAERKVKGVKNKMPELVGQIIDAISELIE